MVAQEAAQLARDHRHAVGRKLHVLTQVEAVDRLDKAYHAHLEQVVHALPAPGKFLHHGQHQPQIARYELLARGLVARSDLFKEPPGLGSYGTTIERGTP